LAWEHVAFMDSWKIKEKNEHALKINEAIVRLEYKSTQIFLFYIKKKNSISTRKLNGRKGNREIIKESTKYSIGVGMR
jgi:hypothetical protein